MQGFLLGVWRESNASVIFAPLEVGC